MRRPRGFGMSENRHGSELRKQSFFCQLNEAAFQDFDAIKCVFTYPSDVVLFFENEQPRGLFLLCEGQIKLSITSSAGKKLILRIAKPGELLELAATVGCFPYQVTAETLRPCLIAFVRPNDFLNFLEQHPEVYPDIVKRIASSYKGVCQQLRTVALASTPNRIARVLIDWFEGTGPAENACSPIDMPLTHEEIAEFIDSSRETVTRTLSDFRERHLITLNGRAVAILNRKALKEMASA